MGRSCVGRSEKWSVWIGAVWVGVRTEVMRGWIGEMRVIGQKNEQIGLFSWVDRSEKRNKKTHHVSSVWIVVRRVRIGTEKWVDRSLELLRSVCGSELVKLCVRVRELRPVRVRELSGKCLKWKFGLKWISVGFALFYDQTENIFSLTQFTMPTKHAIFRKMISEFHFQSKQTDP